MVDNKNDEPKLEPEESTEVDPMDEGSDLDMGDEIEGMDQEELSDWIHNKMIELTKEEEEGSIDSDTPGNIIAFKPKGGIYH